jgi:hypothetical protein
MIPASLAKTYRWLRVDTRYRTRPYNKENRMQRPSLALRAGLLAAAIIAVPVIGSAAPTVGAVSTIATYGEPVMVELKNTQPYLIPVTRYTRNGNQIVADYEYFGNAFGPFPPNIGAMPLNLGELPPGNYTLTARLFDVDHPEAPTQTTTSNLPVMPPSALGVYTVPSEPHAYDDVGILIRSAAPFDPDSMHVTVAPSNVRVDFVFNGSLTSAPPAGWQNYGTASAGHLPPGTYHVEGWGRDTSGAPAQKYFERDVVVGNAAVVVEYYNEFLDHYFMAAMANEIAMLDAGQQGGWKRTGQSFAAWPAANLAPPQAVPVCRFYAKGPNSHFYTADPAECQQLRDLESSQRAQAQGNGGQFLGWGYEGTAFYALLPQGGQCPGGSKPVWREYNGRARQNDSNHRFTPDVQVRESMVGWQVEGVAFCTPA